MQPDDQNQQSPASQPAQNGYVSPSGADVPEYLHMEAVADPVAAVRRKKRRRFILSLSILLPILLAGIGFLGYWVWLQNTPQQRFYEVLERQMQSNYANTKYVLKSTGNSSKSITIAMVSDFSDVSIPKSRYSYAYEDTRDSRKIAGEHVVMGPNEYSARLVMESRGDLDTLGVKPGEWYLVTSDAAHRGRSWSDAFDPFGLHTSINTPLTPLLAGNFDPNDRKRLLDKIRTDEVYEVKGVSDDDAGNVIYTAVINSSKFSQLISYFAEQKNINTTKQGILSTSTISGEVKFTVDKLTQKITGASFSTEGTLSDPPYQVTMTISYPDSVVIKAPETNGLPT